MNFAAPWKLFTRILLIVGAFLSFLVVIELVRVYVMLDRLSPVLAWVYVAILVGGLVASLLYIGRQTRRYPAPLIPPHLPPDGTATHRQLKRYAHYLLNYQERLARNHLVSEEDAATLRDEIDTLSALLHQHPLNEDLRHIIHKSDTQILPPIHQQLHDCAEKEIRRSVRDVMLGVTLSPYHSIDLLIVLYRNISMIFRIMGIYETSPSPRAQLRILRDVGRVIATVNFLYVGRNLIENLFAFIPWVGRVADDIGQGLGAGLFTSACGHAVIDRCSSYHEWEKTAAVESLAAQSKDFLRDVKQIFTKDVLPDIKNRIISEAPQDQVREPGFWENLQKGVNNAFDATIKTVGSIVPMPSPQPQPARAAAARDSAQDPDRTRGGQHEPTDPYGQSTGRSKQRRSTRRRGVARVLHSWGQRVRSTIGLGKRE